MPLGVVVEPPDIEASLREVLSRDVETQSIAVAASHASVGHLVEDIARPVLLLDPMIAGCPVVGVSSRFELLTLRERASLHGRNWQTLLGGLDKVLVSTSILNDVDCFCRMARLWKVNAMAECVAKQPLSRGDGSVLRARLVLRLLLRSEEREGGWCPAQARPYIAAVLTEVGDLGPAELEAACRADETAALDEVEALCGCLPTLAPPVCEGELAFFPCPLSGRCILLDGGRVGMRREPHEVPRGCLLMGSGPVAAKDGSHYFEVMVERKTDFWSARIPYLGFTCTPPEEVMRSRCFQNAAPHGYFVGENVVIGGAGEAWRRLAPEPFQPALRKRPEDHIEHKVLQPGVPEYKRRAPLTLEPSDIMGARYVQREDAGVKKSTIELFVNQRPVFQFTFEGWLPNKPLYPVIDVCFSVYQVSIVDSMFATSSRARDVPGACGG